MEPNNPQPTGTAILLQIFALVFGAAAVLFGGFMTWSTAFPPKCGDWSGLTDLGVVECWVVNLPIGLLTLGIGWFVKKGSPRFRKICIGTALVALALPILASLFLLRRHCP
jgi:hypothetical protein